MKWADFITKSKLKFEILSLFIFPFGLVCWKSLGLTWSLPERNLKEKHDYVTAGLGTNAPAGLAVAGNLPRVLSHVPPRPRGHFTQMCAHPLSSTNSPCQPKRPLSHTNRV